MVSIRRRSPRQHHPLPALPLKGRAKLTQLGTMRDGHHASRPPPALRGPPRHAEIAHRHRARTRRPRSSRPRRRHAALRVPRRQAVSVRGESVVQALGAGRRRRRARGSSTRRGRSRSSSICSRTTTGTSCPKRPPATGSSISTSRSSARPPRPRSICRRIPRAARSSATTTRRSARSRRTIRRRCSITCTITAPTRRRTSSR